MPGNTSSEEGIIVQADLSMLRRGARKVLFEFVEYVDTGEGERRPLKGDVRFGEAVIFREDMDMLPAEIVAVRLQEDTWYVIVTSEVPKSGFPTAKDAMRAAASEDKKLRILKEFFQKQSGIVVEETQSWKPDAVTDARVVLDVIADANKKYRH